MVRRGGGRRRIRDLGDAFPGDARLRAGPAVGLRRRADDPVLCRCRRDHRARLCAGHDRAPGAGRDRRRRGRRRHRGDALHRHGGLSGAGSSRVESGDRGRLRGVGGGARGGRPGGRPVGGYVPGPVPRRRAADAGDLRPPLRRHGRGDHPARSRRSDPGERDPDRMARRRRGTGELPDPAAGRGRPGARPARAQARRVRAGAPAQPRQRGRRRLGRVPWRPDRQRQRGLRPDGRHRGGGPGGREPGRVPAGLCPAPVRPTSRSRAISSRRAAGSSRSR